MLVVVFLLGRCFLEEPAPHSLMFCQQKKTEPQRHKAMQAKEGELKNMGNVPKLTRVLSQCLRQRSDMRGTDLYFYNPIARR
jgi:hypothetical protein